MDTANAAVAQAQAGGAPFADLSPTVLGDPTLTVDEIVGWYQSKGITGWAGGVDLPTMVGYYITEGAAEGVRGDVAFAQAMVETGAFTSPLTRHNNFAGIGACDSCPTGFDFGSPQLGVRAQMQLLHAYADKSLSHPVARQSRGRVLIPTISRCAAVARRGTSSPARGPPIRTTAPRS